MKVAVTSQGKDLDDRLDSRFGRASYFVIVDPESMQFTAFNNEQNLNLPQGAGIQTAQNVINNGAQAIITGNCGPKAFATLAAARVTVYTGARGTVREAIEEFKNGALTKAESANVEGHWA